MVGGLGDTSGPDFDTRPRGQHDVHRADIGEFRQHSTGFAAQARFVTELTQGFPQHISKEAHEDVSQNALFFRMKIGRIDSSLL